MIEINNKSMCESCFCEIGGEEICPHCGYNKSEHTPDPTVLLMGSKLNDKIIIGRVMGKGGFGITYLGYDLRMDKIIAVKEYYPNGISYRAHMGTELSVIDPKAAETFEQGAQKFYTEAEMVSQFNGNPNIMGVYDYFRANNTVYLIMEYLSGMTLKNYVKKHGKLSDGQALYVMDKIAAALSITHSAGVLHRDISPDNIMLCADGKVKLIDFGAARQILTESSSNLTVIMKPGYTPIEQYTKKGKQGAWTDIYSLGVSVYYALTEVILDDPYSRMDSDSEFDENKHGINGSIWEILKKCTMINASDRYGSAIDLRKALKSVSAPLKAEAITLTDDDLKQQSQGNAEEAPTELNSEEAAASEPVNDTSVAEEIEVFEDEEESSEISEKTDEEDLKETDKARSKDGKLFKNLKIAVPIVCAGLAAAAVLCFVLISNSGKTPDDIPAIDTSISDDSTVTTSEEAPTVTDDSPEIIDGKLYLELDTEYPGDWNGGKRISKKSFQKFDGDVKVTLHFDIIKSQPFEYGLIEFRDLSFQKVDIMAFNYGIHNEETSEYWYDILPGMESFSFVVSREAINDMVAGLKPRVVNLIVKSAVLEAYEPSDYEPGEDAVTVSIESKGNWEGSSFIPKETLESFGGDVRVALDIEYLSANAQGDDKYININVCDENWNWVDVTTVNIITNPLLTYTPQFTLGFRDLPNLFTFTITKEQISALGDKGLMFNSNNVYIKTAALEDAAAYASSPIDKLNLKLDTKYPGDGQSGKEISKTDFLRFEGDVKVTLEFERLQSDMSSEYGHIEFKDASNKKVNVMAFNNGSFNPDDYDEHWYRIFNGMETFSFVVSQKAINDMDSGLNVRVINLIAKSAVLEAYDPSEYEPGEGAVTVSIDSREHNSGSSFIPKSILESFGSDVRVALDIEYERDPQKQNNDIIIRACDEYYNSVDVKAENTAYIPWIAEPSYGLGCGNVPDLFTFTITKEQIAALTDKGLMFHSSNVYIKTAALEDAAAYASSPIRDKLSLKLDTEYPGDAQSGKTISKTDFRSFGGDVKVTLELEKIHGDKPEEYGQIEFRDANNKKVKVMAFNNGIGDSGDPDICWYSIFHGMETFSFVVSREAIDNMASGLNLKVINLFAKSAVLEVYDPSEYEPGKDAKAVSINSKEFYNGSSFIPKSVLESFKSDVRVALDIEYESMDPQKQNNEIVITVVDEFYKSVDVKAENAANIPWIEDPSFGLGCTDVPDLFTFTITKEQIAALTDKGLMFNSGNVYIKSAALEDAK